MAEKQNAPEIRFEGFTDPWEQRKLGNCGTTYGGLTGKTKEDFGHGNARFIPYTNVFDNPLTDTKRLEAVEIDSSQNQVAYGDVFFTVSSETPDEVGMSSVWLSDQEDVYLNSFCFGYRQDSTFDPHYLAYMLRSSSVRSNITLLAQGISRFNISKNKVMELSVPVPSAVEQKQLGQYFTKLDSLITLHQRKHDKLCTVKRSMLDKMFPKPGETEPEIRFKGFTDPWEQRKLGELADRYKELVPTPRNGYVRMGVRSHAKGTFLTEVEPGQQIEEQELSRVKADNLVVNIVFAWEHAVAITSADDTKALVSHRFPQFSFHDDMEPGFFRYAILDEAFRWHLWLASPSGAGRNKTLNVGTMLEYEFSVPKKAEQAKIAAFLDRLDDLITLHQRMGPIFCFCAHGSRTNFASTLQG